MIQVMLTPAAGKRLIARAMIEHPAVVRALREATIVIVAGTTNGYIAEELLSRIPDARDFRRDRFFRGLSLPPSAPTTAQGRLSDESQFPGDVVLVRGQWQRGKTLFDVLADLREGDVILKGANAVDLDRREAAVMVAHPSGGTIVAALQAVVGRRARLILPVGVEKRVPGPLAQIAARVNAPGAAGYRLLPVPGEVFTEIEALRLLFGVEAVMMSAGGVSGAEGGVYFAIFGSDDAERAAREALDAIRGEPPFRL